MQLNLQNINYNLNLEFYLNNKVFYFYRLNVIDIELSLKELSYYLSINLLKKYRYNIFTGFDYEYQSVLNYRIELQNPFEVESLQESDEISKMFPLDLNQPENSFANNLYFNILLSCQYCIDRNSFKQEFTNAPLVLLRISPNIFWKNFLQHTIDLNIQANDIILNTNSEIRATNRLKYQKLEFVIETISKKVSDIQENYKDVQYRYDEITMIFSNALRSANYIPNFSTSKELENLWTILSEDILIIIRYYEGKFKLLSTWQHNLLNTFFVFLILNMHQNDIKSAKVYINKMHIYMEEMKKCRDRLITKLYQIQKEAITTWNQSQNRN